MKPTRVILCLAIFSTILTGCGSAESPSYMLSASPPSKDESANLAPAHSADALAGLWVETSGLESLRAHKRLRTETCEYARSQKTASGHVMLINDAGEIYSYDPNLAPSPERMIQWIDNGTVHFSEAYQRANRNNFMTMMELNLTGRIAFQGASLVLTYEVTGIDPVRIELGRTHETEAEEYLNLLNQCVRRR